MEAEPAGSSFWTSLPKLLAGGAALIGAVASLIALFIGTPKESAATSGQVSQSTPTQAAPPPTTGTPLVSLETPSPSAALVDMKPFTSWPLIRRDDFSGESDWKTSEFQHEYYQYYRAETIDGVYQVDIIPARQFQQSIVAPYAPLTDFSLSLDLRVLSNPSDIVVGLFFAMGAAGQYTTLIAGNDYYSLSHWNGTEWRQFVGGQRSPRSLSKGFRLAVVVDGQVVRAYADSELLAEYPRSAEITSGQVGLIVGTRQDSGRVTVEFDNIEYRRKPSPST